MPSPFPEKKIDLEEVAKSDKKIILILCLIGGIVLAGMLYLQGIEYDEIHKLPKVPTENCKTYWKELVGDDHSIANLIVSSKKFSWQCSEYIEKNK